MRLLQWLLVIHILAMVGYFVYSILNVNSVVNMDGIIKGMLMIFGAFFELFAFMMIDIYMDMKDESGEANK